ncbi:hypothetical protein ACROYT_G002070 [Oculina patagonica]
MHRSEISTEEDTKHSDSENTDEKSIPQQEILSPFSSSTSELEELVTPTVAPATPSYDAEPSTAAINTASSIVSHSQDNNYVFSSVILIPPSNPGQVQSSEGAQDDKGSIYSEAVPTKEPEVLSSAVDSAPSTPISDKPAPTPPTPAVAKEEEDSITAALNQAEEEGKPKEEDEEMPSFDEFKRRVLQEEEEKSKQQSAENASGTAHKPKPKKVKERKQSNYASVDCGAKILGHNEEASNADSILVENKDLYMLNPCSAKVWFVVELCDVAHVKSIQIANFELFSSTPESFRVYVSKRYPTREWTMLGTFQAREERTIQTFPLDEPIYAKYFKVEMLSHFGSEHYCPLSLLRVYGSSMMEELEDHETDGQDDNDNSDGDSDVPVLPPEPGARVEDEPKKPNILERAADTVISLVKKITGNGHDKEKDDDTMEKGDALDIPDASGEKASSNSESQDASKNKIVTLVGHEELEEKPVENKTSNASDISVEQDSSGKKHANSKDGKSISVNTNSVDSSLCQEVESDEKSNTTSTALTPCQTFAQAIGQYCLGCFMGQLLFSKKQYQDFTFLVDGISSKKTKLFNTTSFSNSKLKKQDDEPHQNIERVDQDGVNKQELKVTIQDKPSVSESLVEKHTPLEKENQGFSVNVPEPSSSSLEVKSESTVSSPLNVVEPGGVSSRIVKPSQSIDSLVTQKSETSDDQTPSLAEVSVVTETPLNSAQSSSSSTMTLQSSELPVFKESEVNDVKEESGIDEKQSDKEPLVQQSLPPSSESTTSDIQPSPSVNKETSNEPAQDVEVKEVPKIVKIKEDIIPDKVGESTCKDDKVGPTPTECKAPNSLHMVQHSSPDIDVLETKLTDKEGREGTAQLPEAIEKDALPVLNGASQDKHVTDSEDAKVETEDAEKKETSPNVESRESGPESGPESPTPTIAVESQSVEPSIEPASQPIGNNNDLLDSVLPLPAPPIASVSTQELTAAASDANLDATMLSKAQQAAASSAGMSTAVGSGGHKESIFVRLSNKIKALEQNLNMSTLYMEQLNQRYRKSLDELQKSSEKKVALLTNATKKAEVVINSQKEQITKLQSKLDNLTSVVTEMKARMDPLNKEVMERHVIGLCIEVVLIVMLFIVFAKRNNNRNVPDTPREPVHIMNGKGPPRLAITDGRYKDSTFQPTVSLSGREQLLRSFGKTPEPESVGASTTPDDNKLNKADSCNPSESKKKRNRKRKASNTPEPPPDSPSSADSPSPASFVSRTAGLLFFSARGLFSGLHNSWKPKKPSTVHSDPGLSRRSEENHITDAPTRLKQPVMTRAKSLDSVPEETTSQRLAPPPPPPPLPPEFGVVFKRPPDCYYSKKGSVRTITPGPMKYGKYGVLDTQLA